MRGIGVLVAAAVVLGGSGAGAVPVIADYGGIVPATSEDFEGYAPGTLAGSGPFDFDGFTFETTVGFGVSVAGAASCGAANQCLSVDGNPFGDIFPSSHFSGFAPGTTSFGARLLPGGLTDIVGASVEGVSGTLQFLFLSIPEGGVSVGYSDPAGLLGVTLGASRFDDVVTGVAPVPLPPSGLALLAALAGLLALRRRPA